jgi:hypothetical protein
VDESGWVSAHAFYQGELDHLLVHAVAPLTAELAAGRLVNDWFYLRYWDGGPHIRLRLMPLDRRADPEVRALVRARFAEYFKEFPALDATWQERYERNAVQLARWEGISAYSRRLYPNNSLAFIPYQRERSRYGVGASIEAVERHFVESARIALRLLALGTSIDQRATAACAMILYAWFCCEPDPARLAGWIAGGAMQGGQLFADRVAIEAGVADQRDTAVALARRMRAFAASPRPEPGDGALADWARSVTALRDALTAQVTMGAFTPPARGWEGPGGISGPPEARVLPVLDICGHLICNRLGIWLSAEGATRALATAAVLALTEERCGSRGLA